MLRNATQQVETTSARMTTHRERPFLVFRTGETEQSLCYGPKPPSLHNREVEGGSKNSLARTVDRTEPHLEQNGDKRHTHLSRPGVGRDFGTGRAFPPVPLVPVRAPLFIKTRFLFDDTQTTKRVEARCRGAPRFRQEARGALRPADLKPASVPEGLLSSAGLARHSSGVCTI